MLDKGLPIENSIGELISVKFEFRERKRNRREEREVEGALALKAGESMEQKILELERSVRSLGEQKAHLNKEIFQLQGENKNLRAEKQGQKSAQQQYEVLLKKYQEQQQRVQELEQESQNLRKVVESQKQDIKQLMLAGFQHQLSRRGAGGSGSPEREPEDRNNVIDASPERENDHRLKVAEEMIFQLDLIEEGQNEEKFADPQYASELASNIKTILDLSKQDSPMKPDALQRYLQQKRKERDSAKKQQGKVFFDPQIFGQIYQLPLFINQK